MTLGHTYNKLKMNLEKSSPKNFWHLLGPGQRNTASVNAVNRYINSVPVAMLA